MRAALSWVGVVLCTLVVSSCQSVAPQVDTQSSRCADVVAKYDLGIEDELVSALALGHAAGRYEQGVLVDPRWVEQQILEYCRRHPDEHVMHGLMAFSQGKKDFFDPRDVERRSRIRRPAVTPPTPEERALLSERAERGDVDAARQLASRYGSTEELFGLLVPRARAGDVDASIELLRHAQSLEAHGIRVAPFSADDAYAVSQFAGDMDAWRWRCHAANHGHAQAQRELADAHRTSYWKTAPSSDRELLRRAGIEPDDRVAVAWYSLAAGNGDYAAGLAKTQIAQRLSAADFAESEDLIAKLMGGGCPNPKGSAQ